MLDISFPMLIFCPTLGFLAKMETGTREMEAETKMFRDFREGLKGGNATSGRGLNI